MHTLFAIGEVIVVVVIVLIICLTALPRSTSTRRMAEPGCLACRHVTFKCVEHGGKPRVRKTGKAAALDSWQMPEDTVVIYIDGVKR